MAFDIKVKHPEYQRMFATWQLMRDAYRGSVEIKDRGEAYLPIKSGIRAIKDKKFQTAAYDAYRLRAEFPEILEPTVSGITGLIHKDESVIELPGALEPLRGRATEDGLTLDQVHRRISTELLISGRNGVMPGIRDGEVYLAQYQAETVINWDSQDGEVNFVVLDESDYVRDPATNKWEKEERFRELRIEDGRFISRLWEMEGDRLIAQEDEPATIRGEQELSEIPFVFIGSQDLTPRPDRVPMQGLARLALRAYNLDADYVNTLHMTSEPTPWVSGVEKKHAPQSIGASTLWVLEASDARAGMLEFSGPGVDAQEKAIANTLGRAIMFGAQLFADNARTAESGEALRLRLGQQTSTLKNVSAASAAGLEAALKQAALWVGANPEEVSVRPNLEFFDRELTPQEIATLINGWMEGAYSKLTLFNNLQRGGVIDPEIGFNEEEGRISSEDIENESEEDDAAASTLAVS